MIYLLTFLFCTQILVADVSIELSQGYRRDKLTFSISGPHGKPNILSELRFKNIDVYMTHLAVDIRRNDYFMKMHGAYGNIYDGKVRDSDYLGNNRTFEISRSTHDVTGDYTLDTTMYFGKRFTLPHQFQIDPMFGFGFYEQKLRMKHGKTNFVHDIFTGGKKVSHKVHDLNSSYKSRWYSPQIGFSLMKPITGALQAYVNYFFLYPLAYRADGKWNLREKHQQHFTDKAKAHKSFGNVLTVGTKYDIAKGWYARLEYELLKFYAKGGHVYHNNSPTTPFRKANRTASEIRLSVGYKF